MENISRTNSATLLESIIANSNDDPEKQNWARELLKKRQALVADQEKMLASMKVIDPDDPEFNELVMKERDVLFYKIAYQHFSLMCEVDPANQAEYQNEYEMTVRTYEREYSLNSR